MCVENVYVYVDSWLCLNHAYLYVSIMHTCMYLAYVCVFMYTSRQHHEHVSVYQVSCLGLNHAYVYVVRWLCLKHHTSIQLPHYVIIMSQSCILVSSQLTMSAALYIYCLQHDTPIVVPHYIIIIAYPLSYLTISSSSILVSTQHICLNHVYVSPTWPPLCMVTPPLCITGSCCLYSCCATHTTL